mgnify:CR=1 FL=1
MKYILSFLLFLSLTSALHAQRQYTSSSKKAVQYFEQGLNKYQLREYEKALEFVNEAIDKDDEFVEAYIIKGQIYEAQKDIDKAIDSYRKAVGLDPDFFPNLFYSIGLLYLEKGAYPEAEASFRRFVEKDRGSAALRERAKERMEMCRFAMDMKAHPVDFKPENLGDSVNSPFSEYWPSISADGKTLVITRLVPRKDLDEVEQRFLNMPEEKRRMMESMIQREQEDFYISFRQENGWTKARNMGKPLNTKNNEGAQSLSADGMTMYFSACNKQDGKGSCDIYMAEKEGDGWKDPVNLGKPVNSSKWESQPSISPDGQTLFFVSNRSGSIGKKDIWLSRKNKDGSWSKPENLGDSINTKQEEMAPFIHMDNQTLYFASEGWPGMGNLDLFRARRKGDSTWSKPVNLGYPINTHRNEFGLIVNSVGLQAFYSSDRNNESDKDIYRFDLPEQVRPIPSSYMKGNVYDAENGKPLKAEFELISMESGQILMNSFSNVRTGNFLVCIPSNNNYVLNVSRKGYLFYSDNFTLEGVHKATEPYLKDIPLQPIKEGEKIILRNVFYETDSFKLKTESRVELNKVYQLLTENPSLRIEISGHTDNVGTDAYNRELSMKRARSVYTYLVEKGIDAARLEYKGYGEEEPIATNQTPSGRAQNRRTELKVLKR